MLKFTEDHEWLLIDGNTATVGITDYAQKALGDVVFVEIPQTDNEVSQGDEVAVVESVKAASEVYAPASGTITEANTALEEEPALVNQDPEGAGWFFKMTLSDMSEIDALMDEAAYAAHVADLD